MATYLVFLRAVNVGGRFMKMQDLRRYLEEAGFGEVETHIQSGNVRLSSRSRSAATVGSMVESALGDALGFDVPAIVRTPAELAATVRDAPPNPLGNDARHYLMLRKQSPPALAIAELDGWSVDGERLRVVGRDVHLWLTTPFHKAKASNARIEKITGGASTARDWKVVSALASKWPPELRETG